jgi:anti-sigma factor RsiW
MNRISGPIGEDDLHAYVDDQLDPDRRREVDAYLDANPEVKKRVESFGADVAALREGANERLSSPIPVHLRMTEIRRICHARYFGRPGQIAAGIVLLAIGVALGSMIDLRSRTNSPRPPMADAMSAYRAFAASRDNAVEIVAAQRVALVNRISGHLGQELVIPNLSQIGLTLLGGRLLASDEGPGGMFIYAEPNGERIAVYVKTLADGRRSRFGSRQDGDVVAYYWFDGRLGYAVTGKAGSPIVSAAADLVRETYR